MKTIAAFALGLGMLASVGLAARAQDKKGEAPKLEGKYMLVAGKKDGTAIGDDAKKGSYTFSTDKVTIEGMGVKFVMGYKLEEDIPNYWGYAREFVLQDHMFAASNSWSVPAHLYKVSGWSALCKNRNPMSCENAGDDPDAPARWKEARWRKLNPDADEDEMPNFEDPIYSWTDITYLLHKHDVSWA